MTPGLHSIPKAPGALPLIGHAWPLLRHPLDFVTSLRDTGPLVHVNIGTLPIIFVTTADLAHEVMVTKAHAVEKGRLFDRVRVLVGDGLATASSDVHRRHRRLMQPAFHHKQIAHYAEIMSDNALALAESWRPGQRLAIEQVMAKLTINTLAATLFATDIAQPAVTSVRRNLPIILKAMLLRAVQPPILDHLPIPSNRCFDAAAAELRSVIDNVIAATRRRPDHHMPDLLSTLLAARDADTGDALTDTEVRDELVTILFAGTETTASTLAWTFYELSQHPEVEQRLLQEINTVVGTRTVTYKDIPQLKYCRRVLDEVIRLHGVTLLMRRTTAPLELAGITIPPGTEIAFSLYALHKDPDLYPNPQRFDPQRWLSADAKSLPHWAFSPFGAGSRRCIGDAFSWTEATITLATVLPRWRLRPASGCSPQEATSAMPHPDHLPMIAEARLSAQAPEGRQPGSERPL
ncbi:cytochrome P450 [Streptomyces antimycoticus]|uniref:cytochrome P450 n=1 Tax=Streptomyces antimycoticus TaxID=68175 RepID=UPI00343071F1